jgi:hypothetical protein
VSPPPHPPPSVILSSRRILFRFASLIMRMVVVWYRYCAFAQVYLYSFCLIFIVVVLNVFIFIIETGYEKAQRGTEVEDEKDLVLDHDRVCKILDAADKRVGIHLTGVPLLNTADSTNSRHDELVAASGVPYHTHNVSPGSEGSERALIDADFDARLERVVKAALAEHSPRESSDVERLKVELQNEQDVNESLRSAMESEYTEEINRILTENKALRERVSQLEVSQDGDSVDSLGATSFMYE